MRFLAWWDNQLRPLLSAAALLMGASVLTGCTETPSYVKPGPLFTVAEAAPPAQAQVYVYWPAEERGRWDHLQISLCEGAIETVEPGGYARLLVSPGPQCLDAQRVWELVGPVDGTAGMGVARLDLNVEPGQTLFVRIENGRGLLPMALQPVAPARATPEIKRCRQMIPMTTDEMVRAWQAREAG